MLDSKDKIALCGLSDPSDQQTLGQLLSLGDYLKLNLGLSDDAVVQADGLDQQQLDPLNLIQRRAVSFNTLAQDPTLKYIFDISGGNWANTVLPYLNYDILRSSQSVLCGYSDLSAVLNGLYAKIGKPSLLMQIRNLWRLSLTNAQKNLTNPLADDFFALLRCGLEDPQIAEIGSLAIFGDFVQGQSMEGVVLGGNIRCFAKLLGTEFCPNLQDKILVLEQYHGSYDLLISQVAQLAQCGIFTQIKGLVLGCFTQLQGQGIDVYSRVFAYFLPKHLPVFQTGQIGHQLDAKPVIIGKSYLVTPGVMRPAF